MNFNVSKGFVTLGGDGQIFKKIIHICNKQLLITIIITYANIHHAIHFVSRVFRKQTFYQDEVLDRIFAAIPSMKLR